MSQPMDPVAAQEHEPSAGSTTSTTSTRSGSTSLSSHVSASDASSAEGGSSPEHRSVPEHGGGLGHAAPLGATREHAAKAARLAMVSLGTGLVASVTAWWPSLALIGIVLGAIAVATGLFAQLISTETKQRVMAVTGMTGGGFGAMMGIAFGGLPFG